MNENNEYIEYLNSLHNYNAKNKSAYAEKNIESIFYKNVMVKVGLCKHIVNVFKNESSQIIILTGHAGDGKTSIMYQVFNELNASFDSKKTNEILSIENEKKCFCIKDFSEFSDIDKISKLKEAIDFAQNGNFSFIVANTGPLINTYGELFESESEKEMYKIALIDAMDKNYGEVSNKLPHKINIINVATLDNSYFATEFVEKITQESLWEKCSNCSKKGICHILFNKNSIVANKQAVYSFLNKHFVWLLEHGKRLTIRSMTEQLAFMITGGMSCEETKANLCGRLFFANNFFGYDGLEINKKALGILAIKEAYNCYYCEKKTREDETLIMKHGFNQLFSKQIVDFINSCFEKTSSNGKGWNEFLKRIYFLCNILTDSKKKSQLIEDAFSKNFERYLQIKNGEIKPNKQDATLIADALSMIYIGSIYNTENIPLTLSRESGFTQNVQLITGIIQKSKISLLSKETFDGKFNGNKKYDLYVVIEKKELSTRLSLPLINYFEELRNGIISTNIDPQLTHGIESFKAQINEIVADEDEQTVSIAIIKSKSIDYHNLDLSDKETIKAI